MQQEERETRERQQREINQKKMDLYKDVPHSSVRMEFISNGASIDSERILIVNDEPVLKFCNKHHRYFSGNEPINYLLSMIQMQQKSIDKLQSTLDELVERVEFAPLGEQYEEAKYRFEINSKV